MAMKNINLQRQIARTQQCKKLMSTEVIKMPSPRQHVQFYYRKSQQKKKLILHRLDTWILLKVTIVHKSTEPELMTMNYQQTLQQYKLSDLCIRLQTFKDTFIFHKKAKCRYRKYLIMTMNYQQTLQQYKLSDLCIRLQTCR